MSDFFKSLIKEINDDSTYIMDEGLHSAEVAGWIDTGSYILNALLSGSIYGGMPNNKVIALAGDPATGKTFFALGFVKQFLIDNPDGFVFYYDTEAAITKKMMIDRGIDVKRVIIVEKSTVEEFRTHAMKILDAYLDTPKKERKPMFMVLDSLGMLSTGKEVADITSDKRNKDDQATRDMTRAPLIRGAFRALSLRLAKAGTSMIVTNHTYDKVGAMYPEKEMGGGQGLKYSASQIVFLSKKKDKDGTDVVGNIIHCRAYKSRLTKENKLVDVRLSYEKGLDRYYGLLDLALKYDIVKKVSTRIELPDGSKAFESVIYKDPEKYFTKELLDKIDEAAKKEFCYGMSGKDDEYEEDESDLESAEV